MDNCHFITLQLLRFAQLAPSYEEKSIIIGIRYLCGGKLSTRLYDKRDDFDFHIVNFPFLFSNIPSGPLYGVYISQLIRYATRCSHYDDFRYCHKCLVDQLLTYDLRNFLRNFMVDIRIPMRNTKGQSRR